MEIDREREIMEGLPVVCYSTGTLSSLLDKLDKLKNRSDSGGQAEKLKKDLWSLKKKFLDKISGRRVTPKQLKVCMKQVRELVFNIEDWIDRKPELGREKFEFFEAKIQSMCGRLQWYLDLFDTVPMEIGGAEVTIDQQLLVEEQSGYGIFDAPRDELVKHMIDEGDKMRKVVSILGREGLGKTSLAKEIYSELQSRQLFQCQAFISVGKRPAMREILGDLLRQVMPWSSKLKNQQVMDVQDIITELREYLGSKRYFVVVDGIWSTWAWEVINCCLPNILGSRVLTTTCVVDVARSCSSHTHDIVYEMDALSMDKSRILLATLQEEEKWAFEDNSGFILKLCDGIPLAIIVAAGLLLSWKSKSPAEQKVLWESVYSLLKQYSTCDGMDKILHISFAYLTPPARLCLMYLSVFREYVTIKKNHLIWLWAAEGFIPKQDEECMWVTGERCFNELISRRLIEPVFSYEDDQTVGCTVHTVVLDFIKSMSREENFATRATELSYGPFPCDTIRRFSVDCGNEDEAGTLCTSSVHLSSMRSLIVFGGVEAKLDPLANISAFKLLRVLDLEGTKNLANHHMEGIGGLVLLRYLGLAGTGINLLPETIGELELLETLDLRRNGRVMYFPTSIVRLQKVSQLLLEEVDVKDIWEMQELEAVTGICVETSSSLAKVVELLRKSERLRMVGLALGTSVPLEADLVSFLNEVINSKLQFLSIYLRLDYEATLLLVDLWEKVTARLARKFEPQRFELEINYYKLPANLGSLASLTHLYIRLDEANAEDFDVLKSLTNLVLLNLSADHCLVLGRIIIKGGIFPCVKVFSFQIRNGWTQLEFEEGAMPQLQRLGRGFQVSRQMYQAYPDIGMEYLTCLTGVHATINCEGATVSQVEAVEAAIRRQISEIGTKPTLELSREYEIMMRKNEPGQHSFEKARRSTSDLSIEDGDQIWMEEEEECTLHS